MFHIWHSYPSLPPHQSAKVDHQLANCYKCHLAELMNIQKISNIYRTLSIIRYHS